MIRLVKYVITGALGIIAGHAILTGAISILVVSVVVGVVTVLVVTFNHMATA
jgi:hypothetical protein